MGLNNSNFSKSLVSNLAVIILLIFAFFLALELMSAGFAKLGQSYARDLISVASNPFITLFIGLLSTAILQSSSTITTMAVALVAVGSLTVEQAIPLVIGANVGTTITSTLVSLSYITKTAEFRKAVSAGVSHDLYNILMAIIILPLEIRYNLLSNSSKYLTELLPVLYSNDEVTLGMTELLLPITSIFVQSFGPLLTILLSWILIFSSVKIISNFLYKKWIGNTKEQMENALFNKKIKSFGAGLLLTSAVQSSSLTTSLMVPLAATGKVNINKAFYFILGANLGTTLTAILAALFRSEAAMGLAVAHFLFNLIGSILFLNIPFFPRIITYCSDKLGMMTLKNRMIGFSYILFTFFLIPFGLIYFSSNETTIQDPTTITAEKQEVTLEE